MIQHTCKCHSIRVHVKMYRLRRNTFTVVPLYCGTDLSVLIREMSSF